MAEGSMPWQVETSKAQAADEHFKYQYHPGGDPNKAPKNAPSALHSVIVPNVNLPKVKVPLRQTGEAQTREVANEIYHSTYTTSTTSGGRMGIKFGVRKQGIPNHESL